MRQPRHRGNHANQRQSPDHQQALIVAAVLWGGVFALAAQVAAPSEYAWVSRTMSELAAHGYERAWIMRLSMTGFGTMLLCGLLLAVRPGPQAPPGPRLTGPVAMLLVYAVAVVICGVCPVAPADGVTPREAALAHWHSVSAMVMILAIVGGIIWSYLLETTSPPKAVHLAALLLVGGASVAFGLATLRVIPAGQGLFQRLMQVLGSGWILFAYGSSRRTEA